MNHMVRNQQCRSPPQYTQMRRDELEGSQLPTRSAPLLPSPSSGKWDKTGAPPNRLIHLRNDVKNSFGCDNRSIPKPQSSNEMPFLPSALQDEMLKLIRLVLDNNTATLSCDTIRRVATHYMQQTKPPQEPVAPVRSMECDNDPSSGTDSTDLRDLLQVSHLTHVTRKLVDTQAQSILCFKGHQLPSAGSLYDTSSSDGAIDQATATIGTPTIPCTFDARIHNLRRKRTRLESIIRTNVSKFGNGSTSSLDSVSLDDTNGPVSVDMYDSVSQITATESNPSQSRHHHRETLRQLHRENQHVQRINNAIATVPEQKFESASTSATAPLNVTHTALDNDELLHEPDDHETLHLFHESTCQLRTSNRKRALIEHEYHNNDIRFPLSLQPNVKQDTDGHETCFDIAADERRWLFRFFHSLSFLIKQDSDDCNSNRSDESDHDCYMDWCNQALTKDAAVQLGQYPLDEPHRTTVDEPTELDRTQLEMQLTKRGRKVENQQEGDQCTKTVIDEACYAKLLEESKKSLALRQSEVSSLQSANQALNAELAAKNVSLEENKTELLDLEDLLAQIHEKLVKMEQDCGVDHVSAIPDKLAQTERDLEQARSEITRLQYTLIAPPGLTTSTAELQTLNETFQEEREGCKVVLTAMDNSPENHERTIILSQEQLEKTMRDELSVKMTSLEEHKTKLVESQELLEQTIRTLCELSCGCGVGDFAANPGGHSMTLEQLSTLGKDLVTQLFKEREDLKSARLHTQLVEGRTDQLEQKYDENLAVVSALESELRATDVRCSQLLDEAKASAENSKAELRSLEDAFERKSQELIDELALKKSSLEEYEIRVADSRKILEQANLALRQLECDCGVDQASTIPGKLSMALERVASLEKDLAALTNERVDLNLARQESQSFQSKVYELEQQVGIGAAKISTLEEELRATKIRCFQMLEETQVSVETTQAEYTSLEKAFESQKQDMKRELDAQQSSLEGHKTTQELLVKVNQTLHQLVKDCGVDDSSEIPKKLLTALEKVSTLEKDLVTLTNERADLKRTSIATQLLQARISELERQCVQYQATIAANKEKSCETEARYSQFLEEAKAGAETSRAELKSLEILHERESYEMKAELAFKMSSMDEHKTKLVEAQKLLEQANRQLKELAYNCGVDDTSTIPGKLLYTTEQLSTVETELAIAQDKIVCLEKEVKVLSAKVSLATGQAELKSLEEAFHTERQEWKGKLDIKDQRLGEERRVLVESQEHVDQANRTLRELMHDCGVDSISDIPCKLSSAQERLITFENDLDQARCKILRLEHDIVVLNNASSLSHAQEQAASFERKYKVTERLLNKATTEVDSLKQTLARLYTKWETSGQQSIEVGINNPLESDKDDIPNCPLSQVSLKQLQIKLDQAQAEMQYLIQTKLEQQSQYSAMQALQWDLEEERNYNRLKLAQFEKLVNMRHSPTALEMQLRETSLLFAEVQAGKDTLQLQIYRLQAAAKTLQCELFQKNKVIQVLGSRLELTPEDYLETLQIEQDEMLRRATELSVELAESHMQTDELRERLRQKDKTVMTTENEISATVSSSNSPLGDYRPVPSILSSFRIGMDFRR